MKKLSFQLFKHAIVLLFGLALAFCAHAMEVSTIKYNNNGNKAYILEKKPPPFANEETFLANFAELKNVCKQSALRGLDNWYVLMGRNVVDNATKEFINDRDIIKIQNCAKKLFGENALREASSHDIENFSNNSLNHNHLENAKQYFTGLLKKNKGTENCDFLENQCDFIDCYISEKLEKINKNKDEDNKIGKQAVWKYFYSGILQNKYVENYPQLDGLEKKLYKRLKTLYIDVFGYCLAEKIFNKLSNNNNNIVVCCENSLYKSILKHSKDLGGNVDYSDDEQGITGEESSGSGTECESSSADSIISHTEDYKDCLDDEGTSSNETELILGDNQLDDENTSSDAIELEDQQDVSKEDSGNETDDDQNIPSEETDDDKPDTQQDDSKKQKTTGFWQKLTSFFSGSFFKQYRKPLFGVGCLGSVAILGAAYLYFK